MHRGKGLRLFCLILCGASAVGYGVTTANVDARSFGRGPVISMEESSDGSGCRRRRCDRISDY